MSTPLAEIAYSYKGRESKVYAKLEYFAITGSIKDRIASYILENALSRGEFRKGQPIVEVTSGNTGIAFAAAGARLGSEVHIFMPEWASEERRRIMDLYGAKLHLVSEAEGGFMGCFSRADALAAELHAYMPHQFENGDNTMAHYEGSGAELSAELPEVTDFISGIGTGGTLMGVGKRLRKDHGADIVAIEPQSAPYLSGGEIKNGGIHHIEGIGDGFVPPIVERSAIDAIYLINDIDAVLMSMRISRELGISAGISASANFLGCVLRNEEKDGKAVPATVFADDNKKYLSVLGSGSYELSGEMLTGKIRLISVKIR